MRAAAETYAELGWSVFPLGPRAKIPLANTRGCKDATRDPQTIAAMWSDPHRNVAIATGEASRLFVVDVDADKGGAESLAVLEAQHGPLPDTVAARTGSGRHLYFELPNRALKNSVAKLGPGLDTRSTGGYVAAPPSIHPSGAVYQWLDGHSPADLDPAPMPAWLIDLLRDEPDPVVGRSIVLRGRVVSALAPDSGPPA